ncbi:MAG TPA: polyprenol monophosphomannose synthase [Mycobacteriales bacterium]|nr:polyprenol monophosphomannose synthase [Mycobacteriales bacterium]
MSAAPRILVCIPTYNESESLPGVVARLRSAVPEAHILVADDNSPDGTGKLADELAAADSAVHVLHRPGKQGLGNAYLAAFAWGLEQGYDVLVEMDADGSHQPEELPRLLAALEGGPDGPADLVLGSRYVPGGELQGWARSREALSRGGNAYVRIALGLPIKDATGGFRAYRRRVLETIDRSAVDSQGYCFQVDLAWRTWQAGFRVVEVPITFVERALGTSKMSQKIVTEALWQVTRWGVTRRGAAKRARERALTTGVPSGRAG